MALFNLTSLVAQLMTAAFAFVLPDARLTPGAVGPESGTPPPLTVVCSRGFSRTIRHPYDAVWRRYRTAIFRAYEVPHDVWKNYTIDHLVPLELDGRPFGVDASGRPDLRNVWPEPKQQAEEKDAVEGALHAAVCYRRGYRGLHMSLHDAQAAITRDWSRTPIGLPQRGNGRE